MNDNKQKCAYWIRPSMVEEMESMLEAANATSKSDFVCQAISFYIAYLHQKKSIDFISPLLAQTIKSEVESVEHNLSEMLFKLAVEQAKCNHMIAYVNQIDNEDLIRLHDMCAGDVAHTNGIISFDLAYKYQHGES